MRTLRAALALLWGLVTLSACQTSTPSEPILTRCETSPRWIWQPTFMNLPERCEPLPEEMASTPRTPSQYLLSCPNHPDFCYRKAELMCKGPFVLLRTDSFGTPGQLLIECR
jgi:hypothetical protein